MPRNQKNARLLLFRREEETRRRAEGALKALQVEKAQLYVLYCTVLNCSIALNKALIPTLGGKCMSPRWRHTRKLAGTSNLSALPPALHTTDLPALPALQARQAEEARQRSKSKRTGGGFVVTFDK